MEKLVVRVFLDEVERQCRYAHSAFQDLVSALHEGDTDCVFFAAHSLLVAVANVSKLLWPAGKDHEARGKQLREILQVRDDCPVSSRSFRNHFEHFDERLDRWARSSKRRNFADSNIGPPGFISGLDPEDYMRTLDPTSLTLTFHGDSYDLRGIMEALRPIHTAAQRESPLLT